MPRNMGILARRTSSIHKVHEFPLTKVRNIRQNVSQISVIGGISSHTLCQCLWCASGKNNRFLNSKIGKTKRWVKCLFLKINNHQVTDVAAEYDMLQVVGEGIFAKVLLAEHKQTRSGKLYPKLNCVVCWSSNANHSFRIIFDRWKMYRTCATNWWTTFISICLSCYLLMYVFNLLRGGSEGD